MLVKSVSFLPASVKSMNPMQKHSQNTELFDCTQKMLAIVFIPNKLFNFFRNMFNTKPMEKKQLHLCYKINQSNVCLHLPIQQGLSHKAHPLFFLVYCF